MKSSKRSCFYFVKDTIYQYNVSVDLQDGFSYESQRSLTNELATKFSNGMRITDVSPVSLNPIAKSLWPTNLIDADGNPIKNRLTQYQTCVDPNGTYHGVYDFMYLKRINNKMLKYILSFDGYFDIYFNPDRKVVSPAKSIAMLRLLIKQNKTDYLQDLQKFMYWYYINEMQIIESDKEITNENIR